MSDLWSDEQTLAAARASAWQRPSATPRFTAAAIGAANGFTAWAGGADLAEPDHHGATIFDPDALRAEAYAAGLAEGRRTVAAEIAAERAAIARLTQTLACLEPEPPEGLAQMLAETVKRLVAQVVGEVTVDAAMLRERVTAAAALIVDEAGPARLHLAPEDIDRMADARIDLELVADPALAQGMIRIETGAGWIEDGPEVRMEKLRTALDRMGV